MGSLIVPVERTNKRVVVVSIFNLSTYSQSNLSFSIALTCGNQLPCRTRGGCYRSAQRCDGMNDCPDGSDEEGCDAALCGPHRDGFLCRNRHCVPASSRCDGVQDCGDFSDEETCMKVIRQTSGDLGGMVLIFYF